MSTENNIGVQTIANQPGAIARHTKPSHEPHSRATQKKGRSHQGVRTTTRHHCPSLVCTRPSQY